MENMGHKKKELTNKNGKEIKKEDMIDHNVKLAIEKMISDFITNPRQIELSFPPSFTSAHRKYVHQYVRRFGLKSKSSGKSKFYTLVLS